MGLSNSFNIMESYDKYYKTGLYRQRYPLPNSSVFALVHQTLREAGNRVLDFGCGNGRYAAPLLERTDATVVGYDISRIALDELAVRCKSHIDDGRLSLVHGDLNALVRAAEPDEPFNLALMMFGVLGHVPTRAGRVSTLRRVASLLGPGGRLIVTVPSALRRFPAERKAARPLIDRGELEPGDITYFRMAGEQRISLYYHLYTLDGFIGELAEAGYCVSGLRPESILPESGVVSSPVLRMADRILGAVTPLRLAYGFLAVAEPGPEVEPDAMQTARKALAEVR